MMSKRSQVIEIIRLVTLLTGGLSVPAYAQAPAFSPPELPALPGLPSAPSPAPSAPAATTATMLPEIEAPSAPAAPDTATVTAKKDAIKEPTSGDALSDLPLPVAPESGDKLASEVAPAPATTATATVTTPAATENTAETPPPGIPAIVLDAPVQTGTAPVPMAAPLAPVAAVEEAPAAPAHKTWETKLAPTSFAYNTKFNYRRQLLPDTIYRTQYDYENSHLPRRTTRADYEGLLLQSAAANDINATRALLNAGTNPNTTNQRGETPLALARRYGAYDTAALLQARGAR